MGEENPGFLMRKLAAFQRYRRYRLISVGLVATAVLCFVVAGVLSLGKEPGSGVRNLAAAGLLALLFGAVAAWLARRARIALRAPWPKASASLEEKTRATTKNPDEEPVEPTRLGEWVSCRVRLDAAIELPSAAGANEPPAGKLELPAGPLEVAFRFTGKRQVPGEGISYPLVETRLRDRDGSWWQADTFLSPDAFCWPMCSPDHATPVIFWERAPEAWKTVLRESCLITDVEALLDSRERFELPVGEESVTMMLKYQGPALDLAWWEQEKVFIVRARQMHYEVWKPAAETGKMEYVDIVDGVVFGYLLPPEALIFPAARDEHWSYWEQWHETENPASPRPTLRPATPPG